MTDLQARDFTGLARTLLAGAQGPIAGCTQKFQVEGGPAPEEGYVVGGLETGLVFEAEVWEGTEGLRPLVLSHWLSSHASEYSWDPALQPEVPGLWVGSWMDSETGTIHIDICYIFACRGDALSVARRNQEIAIWDLGAAEEIRV